MLAPHKPENEQKRLESLRSLLILDSPAEDRFDLLTTYATLQFQVPVALVSLIDENRQWFKSKCGLGVSETPRDISFCGHTILADDVLVISDALKDPRFSDNPLVTDEPKIRFYAGAPIILKNGLRMGSFCLIDQKPHRLEAHEIAHLKDLAEVTALEMQGIAASRDFMERANSAAE